MAALGVAVARGDFMEDLERREQAEEFLTIGAVMDVIVTPSCRPSHQKCRGKTSSSH